MDYPNVMDENIIIVRVFGALDDKSLIDIFKGSFLFLPPRAPGTLTGTVKFLNVPTVTYRYLQGLTGTYRDLQVPTGT